MKTIFGEKEKVAKTCLEEALNFVRDEPSWWTAKEAVGLVDFEIEVVVGTVEGQDVDEKGHTIDNRGRQSDADVRAAIRKRYMARAGRGIKAYLAIVNLPTNVVVDGKGATSDAAEGKEIAKCRSDFARESDAPSF